MARPWPGRVCSVNKAYFLEKSLASCITRSNQITIGGVSLIIARKFVIVVCSVLIRTDPTFSCRVCYVSCFCLCAYILSLIHTCMSRSGPKF